MGGQRSWLAGIALLLLSVESFGRQVKRSGANQILDTLSLTPKSPNALSTISRKNDLPLAACDKTRRLLHRGDWYHKRGAVSDLCTTEWLKLDADEQKLFFPVKTLEDLGEQAWLYQQQHDQVVPKQLPTVHLDSKTVLKAAQQIDAKANTAGAQMNSLMEKVLPAEVLDRTKTELAIGVLAVAMVVWAATRSNLCKRVPKSLAAELLAEEAHEQARKTAAEGRTRKSVSLGPSAAAKEAKVQRNRSRKERRRLVGVDDDDSGSTGSTGSQSESGGGPQLLEPQIMKEEGSWMPAKMSRAEPPREKSGGKKGKKGEKKGEKQQRVTSLADSSPKRNGSGSSPANRAGNGSGQAPAAAPTKPSNGKEQPKQQKPNPKAAPAPAATSAAAAPAPAPAAAAPAPAAEREKKPRNNRGKSETFSKDGEKQNGRRENGRGKGDGKGRNTCNGQSSPGKTGGGGGGGGGEGGGGSKHPRSSGDRPPRKSKPEKATVAKGPAPNAWTARATPPIPNKPDIKPMSFDLTPAFPGPKPMMLSPAFAKQASPANSRSSLPKTPQSVPSSPGILFGAFDQWGGVPLAAADLNRDTSYVAPVAEVEAPEDVSLVAVEKVQCNGKAYLVDRANRVVYDFEDGLNEVLDPEPVGTWVEERKTIELYAVTQD